MECRGGGGYAVRGVAGAVELAGRPAVATDGAGTQPGHSARPPLGAGGGCRVAGRGERVSYEVLGA